MKITVEYHDEDKEDWKEHQWRMRNAPKLYRVLQELDNELRSLAKYQGKESVEIDWIRKRIYELQTEYGVELYE